MSVANRTDSAVSGQPAPLHTLGREGYMATDPLWYQRSPEVPSFLVVPGIGDAGPAHWQNHWRSVLPKAHTLMPRQRDSLDVVAWAKTIAHAASAMNGPLIVAHSFGCMATLLAAELGAKIAGALLVAPADARQLGVDARPARRRLPFPSVLVASTNDPWLKLVTAGELASVWGSRFVPLRDAGHINAESGFGPWPEGLQLLRHLAHGRPSGTAASHTN